MILYSQKEFDLASYRDTLPVQCDQCNKIYRKTKVSIYRKYKMLGNKQHFCSIDCLSKNRLRGVHVNCHSCGKEKYILNSQLKKSKSKRFFCSRSCAATYNNGHKRHGFTRSKLELFLEKQVSLNYPLLKYITNDTTAIRYELDFYFPEINFAIEINGIVHYEPIYGLAKFERIQFNDRQKILLCNEHNIELCIVPNTYTHLTKDTKAKVWSNVKHILDSVLARK